MRSRLLFIIKSAVIAAAYFALTFALAPISFFVVQFRISEALTILPFFTPAAIPGLFVGCLLSNLIIGSLGLLDVILGSLATLISAVLTYICRKTWLAPLPPVVVNAVLVGITLHVIVGEPLVIAMGGVALGQLIVCYGIGLPLLFLLRKYQPVLFPESKKFININ